MQPVSQLPPVLGTVVSRRVSDGADIPVIPDCCNVGITARILVALNIAALLLAALTGDSPGDMLTRAAVLCGVLEPVAIASLVALCGVRRVVSGRSLRTQWAVGLAVPACLVMAAGLIASPYFVPDLRGVGLLGWVLLRGLGAVAVSALAFEYFRLRSLSFAPSLADARLQALQARIRPHFLFNSLNTVLGLMRSDPRRAEYTLENLADLFRVFMRDTRELVPLDEEAVTCQQYIAIEELRLGERLQVNWHLEDMPGDALLPSLLLQPLIENAVHHGIEPSSEPGLISVSIARVGERIRVEILNPIPDRPPTRSGNQMALSNVRERLMLLYDMEAELKTGAADGQFRVLLEFPYRKERRRRDVRRHFSPYR
ncbi:MAG: histidine kinase [Betaproteobacteria bacterium]|nr:histidine kinase [Betaproteobacteria bacterium]